MMDKSDFKRGLRNSLSTTDGLIGEAVQETVARLSA